MTLQQGAFASLAFRGSACRFSTSRPPPSPRTEAAAAHQAGLSLREVAEISGHRSLAGLERYLDEDAAREKAEAARSLLVG